MLKFLSQKTSHGEKFLRYPLHILATFLLGSTLSSLASADTAQAPDYTVSWLGGKKLSVCAQTAITPSSCLVTSLPRQVAKISDVISLGVIEGSHVGALIKSEKRYYACAVGGGQQYLACKQIKYPPHLAEATILRAGNEWRVLPKENGSKLELADVNSFFASVNATLASVVAAYDESNPELNDSVPIATRGQFGDESDEYNGDLGNGNGGDWGGMSDGGDGFGGGKFGGGGGVRPPVCIAGPMIVCINGKPSTTLPPDLPVIKGVPPVSDCLLFNMGCSAPPAPPKPPPSEDECSRLNGAVQDAKSVTQSLGRCKAGMSQYELLQRKNAFLDEASARAKRDQKCWGGGDAGHQQAQSQAWQAAGTCGRIANP